MGRREAWRLDFRALSSKTACPVARDGCKQGLAVHSVRSWTDGRKELLIIFRNEEQEHRDASGIGVVCITSGSDSCDIAFSGGGALSGVAFGRRHQLGARAVGEVTFSIGLVGVPIAAVFASHVVALSHGGAAAAQSRHCRARSTVRVVQAPTPSFGRACR